MENQKATSKVAKNQNPPCKLSCQFKEKAQCSIGIECPGKHCTFREYRRSLVLPYLRSIEQYA